MKAILFALIFLICTLFPSSAEALPSRSTSNSYQLTGNLTYQMAELNPQWEDVAVRLSEIEEDLEGYIVLDAIYVEVEEDCDDVMFQLIRPLTVEDEPIVIFITPDDIYMEEIGFDEDGNTHLSLYKGEYFLCFCIRGE